MFDPDYRRKPWNRSKYAPKNSGSRSKTGKGNAITNTAALYALLLLSPLWWWMYENWGNISDAVLGSGVASAVVLWSIIGVWLRRREYQRLVGTVSTTSPRQHPTKDSNEPISWIWFLLCLAALPFMVLLTLAFLTVAAQASAEGETSVTIVMGAIGIVLGVMILSLLKNMWHRLTYSAPSTPTYTNAYAPQDTATDTLASFRRPTSSDKLPPSVRHLDNSTLDPAIFEEEIAWLISATTPYDAQVVGGAGDGGIDVEVFNQRVKRVGIVQCKRYDPSRPLPPAFVRELFAVKHRHRVSTAYLATTTYFTSNTRQEARELGIRLMDGKTIRQMQKRAHTQIFAGSH